MLLLSTTVLPAANAGAILPAMLMQGKFHGISRPATPYGSLTEILKVPGVFVLAVPCVLQPCSAKYLNVSAAITPSGNMEIGRPMLNVSNLDSTGIAPRMSSESL